ncbi:MAG TPA: S1-like domain-containing RNA-binding protein [Holophagaceae bacterium]|nr:S1-like domain-containing RNA-binding protein [Holophagaceae bacterium]
MATLGITNTLKVLRVTREGAVLDGGPEGELLLPLAQMPPACEAGQTLTVFVYKDGQGLAQVSARLPLAQRGEVAHLKVVATTKAGAFLAWGLPQDLFLPWQEVKSAQRRLIKEGQKATVFVFTDEEGRIAASMRLDDFLTDEAEGFREGDKVTLLVGDRTDLGVRVIVNHRHWGMVHTSDIYGTLLRGETREGWIKGLREDRKLNVALHAPGYAKVDAIAQGVLDDLAQRGGYLAVTDKTKPEEIYALFGISKKAFKLSIGALYKQRRILIEAEGIRLVKPA